MRVLVTGGAGCIGSDLVAMLASNGHEVRILDNLSSGRRRHLTPLLDLPHVEFTEGDLLDWPTVDRALSDVEFVHHLAANPDIKFDVDEPTDKDLRQNVLATYHVLEAMRKRGVRRIAFTSTSAVYGRSSVLPIPEDLALPRPISLYGASKLACEHLLSAFQNLFEFECWIFRLANIVGPKVRKRGRTVLADFISRLFKDPERLVILGDGTQQKSYLLTSECVDAMLHCIEHARESFNIFNVGGDDWISVSRIAELVVEAMGLPNVRFEYTGGDGGWPGDVSRFRLDVSRVNALGWRACHNSEEAIRQTIKDLLEQPSLFDSTGDG
jgi:UDP-glucose 4-epimerase